MYFCDGTITNYVQTNLNASTHYRFRLRAADPKVGYGHRSPETLVLTKPKLVNEWHQISARTYGQGRSGGGRRYINPPTDEVSMFPAPLQGSSMNSMLGYVFMFGGRSTGQDCDIAIAARCRYFDSVNNFLWRLDTLTYTWCVTWFGFFATLRLAVAVRCCPDFCVALSAWE